MKCEFVCSVRKRVCEAASVKCEGSMTAVGKWLARHNARLDSMPSFNALHCKLQADN